MKADKIFCLLSVFVLSIAMVGVVSALEDPDDPPDDIPEFTTISIPVVAILGLLFFFSYRKRRKGEDTKEKTQDFEVGK